MEINKLRQKEILQINEKLESEYANFNDLMKGTYILAAEQNKQILAIFQKSKIKEENLQKIQSDLNPNLKVSQKLQIQLTDPKNYAKRNSINLRFNQQKTQQNTRRQSQQSQLSTISNDIQQILFELEGSEVQSVLLVSQISGIQKHQPKEDSFQLNFQKTEISQEFDSLIIDNTIISQEIDNSFNKSKTSLQARPFVLKKRNSSKILPKNLQIIQNSDLNSESLVLNVKKSINNRVIKQNPQDDQKGFIIKQLTLQLNTKISKKNDYIGLIVVFQGQIFNQCIQRLIKKDSLTFGVKWLSTVKISNIKADESNILSFIFNYKNDDMTEQVIIYFQMKGKIRLLMKNQLILIVYQLNLNAKESFLFKYEFLNNQPQCFVQFNYIYYMNSNNQDYPRVDRVKFVPSADQIISQVEKNQPNISESLIKEILVESGFHSNDNNAYKLIAHATDYWLNQIAESIVGKKQTQEKRRKDPDMKLQLTTEDIVNDFEQKGIKLHDPFKHPSIDSENITLENIMQTISKE